MTAGRESIDETWLRLRSTSRGAGLTREEMVHELPLRSELFSADQMERHGRALARSHKVEKGRARDLLLARLSANKDLLAQAIDLLAEAVSANRRITPAGEWLLDNFYLIEEQIRIAKRHLPKNYSRELPRLVNGPSAGFPRVYDIALEAISHGDGRVDTESLSLFIASYQSVSPLALGELWAIPIMLRLALIENLRRVAAGVIVDRMDRNVADEWADQLAEIAESDPKNLVVVIADMARSEPPRASSFVAELTRRLHGQSSALALPLTWVEQWLGESGQTIEQQVQAENQQQATDQVSISNSICSMRYLSAMDWREFVETMSVVEQALRDDPIAVYSQMDFATRDRYRHVVERLARRCSLSEEQIAQQVVALARKGLDEHGPDALSAHVGHFLIGNGSPQLQRDIAYRAPFRLRPHRREGRVPGWTFFGPIIGVTLLAAVALLLELRVGGWHGWTLWLLVFPCLLVASELAMALVNWAATLLVAPRQLPRMDYSDGLPSDQRTLVVVPTLIGNEAGVDSLVEALEVRFLANRGPHIHFALLTDFFDAAQQTLPTDAGLLEHARSRIAALNAKYSDASGEDRFFLLHRPRLWNAGEGAWIGRERKRGKLADLNAFLRCRDASAFQLIEGHTHVLGNVRYVITLDTDTLLPRDAALEFVGTMAHPLNRARWDDASRRITSGYGILQPRVGVSLSGAQRSRYARWFGSEPGIDPYTRAVSDVYQDLFCEGSFIGKGIYDVAAFEHVMAGRFPDSAILSHDLLEGCYARSGLMSDAELFEDYPARYAADVARRHRWIRGDWQLLPWLFRRVRHEDGALERNPLSRLSQWKVFDNLRRSLVPTAMLLLFVFGWTLHDDALWWTLSLLALLLLAPSAAIGLDLLRKSPEMPMKMHLRGIAHALWRQSVRVWLQFACLPHEAAYACDAIVRTLWRLLVSRRHLLQWNPSSEVERTQRTDLVGSYRAMWFAPLLALVVFAWLVHAQPLSLFVAVPILALWLVAPALAWWISQPVVRPAPALDSVQLDFLHRLARRTWSYFETHIGPDDHWLPPDNVQEQPVQAVAHRTSPTNIGLSLLANLSAHDFGYIATAALIKRCTATLETLESLDRHRGHFYNWYDTQTMHPLSPRYISSVDSGNLAGHLLVLSEGLTEIANAPLLNPRIFDGIADTFAVLREHVGTLPSGLLDVFRDMLDTARTPPLRSLHDACAMLQGMGASARALVDGIATDSVDTQQWAQALHMQCHDALADLLWCAPWLEDDATMPDGIPAMPSLRELARHHHDAAAIGNDAVAANRTPPTHLQLAAQRAAERIAECDRLALVACGLAEADFDFLYDRGRSLLAVGYNVDERRLDESYYDLLASEARLGSFVAIAQGELPQESWFALGRQLTRSKGETTLLSWSGSMFEYLMPQLVMPCFEDTLLDASMRAAVARHIDYGRQRNVPWGISESGYNTLDAQLNYQYRAFGVPGLGLKRGLAQDLVIAPYAAVMALMVAPEQACANLQRMAADGYSGACGMYEAIDFTPARVPRGQDFVVIRSFMAHHEGMSLLSLAYLLLDQPMQRRFCANRHFQATILLLQERVPHTTVIHPHRVETISADPSTDPIETRLRVFNNPDNAIPAIQMLSNGRYHLMVTNSGGGYSRLGDMSLTRWHEDATCDATGSFCYLRDLDNDAYWSCAYQPTRVPVDGYEAIFSDARAEFRGRRNGIDMHTEIVVSPEDDIELRRITITNRRRVRRTIELTSYAEVVLATAASDDAHPAFSKLFVQTELLRPKQAILCNRRPQAEHDHSPWMFHLAAVHGADVQAISYETDRARFIGRGRDLSHPLALDNDALSDSDGSVLDPVVAIRVRLILEPDQSVVIDFVTGVGDQRDACLALIEKYRDRHLADRVFDLAWTHSQVVRRQINASQSDAQLYERLAGSILHMNPGLRAEASVLIKNRRGQSGLWGYSISGDLPIVLLQIADTENIDLVRQVVQAHAYWRLKGLAVDLMIWNEDHAGYRQVLQDQIMGLIAAGIEANTIDKPGGIFVRPAQQMSTEDRILLQSVARVVLSDTRGTLAEQVVKRMSRDVMPKQHVPSQVVYAPSPAIALDRVSLQHDNGLGGFSDDGREYIITVQAGQATPAPWCNILANAQFGCVVSESGLGYTWGENAHEFRLTPWHNDPVSDPCGEAYYLRDEDTGRVWSPTLLPCRGEGDYRIRHGFGYTVYEHIEDGIASELCVYVAVDAPIKYAVLKLRNLSGRTRRISVIGYVEWVLGDLRGKSLMHVVTEHDTETGAVFGRNPYNTEFDGRVGFFDVDEPVRSVTGDRAEFIGRNGNMDKPAALGRVNLSGRVGAGLDPCAAIGITVSLIDDIEHPIVFRLGAAHDEAQARALVQLPRDAAAAQKALQSVHAYWREMLGTVQVHTPDAAVDVLANGWLMYQVIASRYLGRSGFYQSGGAFGFRDQLQDVMSMVHAAPALVREHLLRSAAHQFPEGDVQHWWHPPQGRGVRTHCSDDYLWLPFAVCRYVEVTGDRAVLDAMQNHIEGRQLAADEESYYDLPVRSPQRESLYRHCVLAIEHGLSLLGANGLPLIGTGDWNDGMNRVGAGGKGESVWLGFFLYSVLMQFSAVARSRSDDVFAERCLVEAGKLRDAIDTHAWDGNWYRRAWFDDGTPLGTHGNAECAIDSIAQSWSVLSGAGGPERVRQAMQSLDTHLAHRDTKIVQLLDPPFDRNATHGPGYHDPGYIAAYVPGVRENGGQYTHAAVWATMAFAELGDSEKAWDFLRLINPIHHSNSLEAISTYKVEPYVLAADVYAVAPHTGRGGWTWYTGSAGWMYRLIVESLLGLDRKGDTLQITPCIPPEWPSYSIDYRHGRTTYRIAVVQDAAAGAVDGVLSIDGVAQTERTITLVDDGRVHAVAMRITHPGH